MEWHVDGSSKLTSVNSEQVDLALGRCNQDVVLAWMVIETCNFAVVNEELCERRHIDPVVFDFNQLEAYAVGCSD